VGGHYGVHAFFDRGAEGNPLQGAEALDRHVQFGETQVRIHIGIAVAGEMFDGDENAGFGIGVRAFNVSDDVPGNVLWILAVRADVDDGIIGVVIDIGVRCEDPVDAQSARLTCGVEAFETGSFIIAAGGIGHVVRELHGAGNPHGRAAFEIGRDQQRRAREALDAVEEDGHFVRVGILDGAAHDAVDDDESSDAEVHDPAAEAPEVGGIRARVFSKDGHDHQLCDAVSQGHVVHPALCRTAFGSWFRGRRRFSSGRFGGGFGCRRRSPLGGLWGRNQGKGGQH
jgi:hypothetical protein